jgi:4-hydroxythreonine-4-phosphate dehydrogenase
VKPIIAVTVGDPAGIGPEIVAKALRSRRVLSCCTPVIFGNPRIVKSLAFGKPHKRAGVFALDCIKEATCWCLAGQARALVTAPVSKQACAMAEPGFKGHTELLARLCKTPDPVMMMQTHGLRAVMITRHCGLSEVSRGLSQNLIIDTVKKTFVSLKQYGQLIKRAVICALNPHAGEAGAIGSEEQRIIIPAIKKLRILRYVVDGPIAADTAFRKLAEKEYDFAFGMYHDQVMIPLKVLYPREMVNITLGLPFPRTSPAHGVAYDIAGKNKADPQPMIEAIVIAATTALS